MSIRYQDPDHPEQLSRLTQVAAPDEIAGASVATCETLHFGELNVVEFCRLGPDLKFTVTATADGYAPPSTDLVLRKGETKEIELMLGRE